MKKNPKLPRTMDSMIHDNNMLLVRLRWVMTCMLIIGTSVYTRWLDIAFPENNMYALGFFLLVYNASVVYSIHRGITPIERLIMFQVLVDWCCLAIFLHLSGGITSPALVIFFIHVLVINIILPDKSPFPQVLFAIGIVASITLLEAVAILPHYTIIPDAPPSLHTNPYYIGGQLIFFAGTLFVTTYIAYLVMGRLHERERQISALFLTTKAVSSSLELSEVLDQLAKNTAEALSVTAASIRLLDVTGERLNIAASYGLSQAYLDKGHVLVSQSRLDRLALDGHSIMIADAPNDSRIQYPAEVASEGISSILVVPIIGKRKLGVLRAYSQEINYFRAGQEDFMGSIARQGATAIENAMAHDALQKAEEQRTQFVRIVTHELRAPVTGAQSLVRVLQNNLAGELTEKQQDIMGRLGGRMDSLLLLINDLLSLAESKAIDLQQPLTSVSLLPIVQIVIDHLIYQAEEKQITLNIEKPSDDIVILATVDGLTRLLSNIIGNAIKYTPEAGHVHIKIVRQSPNVNVIVHDTGIGIPEEAIGKIGESFYRAPNARRSGIIGTGLGLTVSKQLIDYFLGQFLIESVVDEGTTVTVTFPIYDHETLS